ncbi:hypothetical protein [Paraburkholderia elongata]|uniref:Uncharacterized protein n=1 Tax=Paraburkholderia elongata TaxID=2675747 RepID=A0A972NJ40_9BURK|nr:hypothetical protein [Paraburkholderia elongata]NPT54348.1 hypothetical protein [Paraburkholderia elongata]
MELGQVVLCRALCSEAEGYLSRNTGVHVGLAVSIAQDAVELFLRAVMKDRPVSGLKIPDEFVKCMDYIDAAANQDESKYVPFRARLIELNKARVNFKHYGLIPDKADSRRLLGYVGDFFDVAAKRFFDVRFSELSVADLVTSTAVRNRLKDAERSLQEEDLEKVFGYSAEAVEVATGELIALLYSRSHRWSPSSSAGLDDAAIRFARELEGYLDDAAAGSERMTIMLALAVNISELVRFESVVPVMHRMIGGHYKWERMQDASALTISDAAFAVDFATKFALSVQGRMSPAD